MPKVVAVESLDGLQVRSAMDPKRHYKANDTKGIPTHFQVKCPSMPRNFLYICNMNCMSSFTC